MEKKRRPQFGNTSQARFYEDIKSNEGTDDQYSTALFLNKGKDANGERQELSKEDLEMAEVFTNWVNDNNIYLNVTTQSKNNGIYTKVFSVTLFANENWNEG